MKPSTHTETTLLVIGYGNTLRQDDAAGPLVAERIGALGITGVRVMACRQLTPELAAELAEAVSVVFVDATSDTSREVELERIAPADSAKITTHAADPGALLAMARELYGSAPAAWLLKVPAEKFGHGERLSELTLAGIEAAVSEIRLLIAEWVF
ncbi:MAG: hydrogenase maturation protease [Lacunisphaera sp.]|nr:hydrogenase maturation protease [Lacunisphaera sp.]